MAFAENCEATDTFSRSCKFLSTVCMDFSSMSHPLDKLRKKFGSIKWTEGTFNAFNALKSQISKKILLHFPDESKSYEM